MPTTVQILNGPIIEEGESISEPIDCSAGRISRLTMPAGWDQADLSFQVSTDGFGYNELFWADGDEYVVKAGPGRTIIIDQDTWIPGLFVKIRSGTYGVHVAQTARREFAIALLVETEEETPPASRTREDSDYKRPKQPVYDHEPERSTECKDSSPNERP